MARNSSTWTRETRPRSPGRTRARPRKATLEIKDFYSKFFNSTEYRDSLKQRILKGKAMPIETLGYYYLYGKPKERVQLLNGQGEDLRYDDLLNAIAIRITRLATSRHLGPGTPSPEAGATGGPVLELVRTSETEPASANGHVDGLAPVSG